VTDPQTTPVDAPVSVAARPRFRPTRPVVLVLVVAFVAAVLIAIVARGGSTVGSGIERGKTVPGIIGTTLDGTAFDLASLRGHPVLVNFWGPSCIPCREETPLLATLAARHAADGFVIVGVLADDPVEPARQFAAQYGATWPTVIDPGAVLKAAYHVIGRPQSFYVDRNGIYRDLQIGPVTDADFERKYATIAGGG
jgi:cytochrome c biogenesis protein CcmG, thiol:disulfide interchange protein DsbE